MDIRSNYGRKTIIFNIRTSIRCFAKSKEIHCLINAGFGLIGADWNKKEVEEALKNAETIEIGGQQCKSMGHALVCIPKNAKKQSDLYFFESDKEKVDYYEKLLKE